MKSLFNDSPVRIDLANQDLKIEIHTPTDLPPRDILRPDGWMENPYIGKDGADYHSPEGLDAANKVWFEVNFPKKEKLVA